MIKNKLPYKASAKNFFEFRRKGFLLFFPFGSLLLTIPLLNIYGLLKNPAENIFIVLIMFFGGLIIEFEAIFYYLFYIRKVDFILHRKGVVVPNPPRKDIIKDLKTTEPYFIPFHDVESIKTKKELTPQMKIVGVKEPRKVCIIKKENGDKIKLREDYFEDDYDEFVNKLIEVYNDYRTKK